MRKAEDILSVRLIIFVSKEKGKEDMISEINVRVQARRKSKEAAGGIHMLRSLVVDTSLPHAATDGIARLTARV